MKNFPAISLSAGKIAATETIIDGGTDGRVNVAPAPNAREDRRLTGR
jgi:hypothetical protein